ncbi:MAG: hypothetical protein LBI39_04240 [Puniceicoccales bacterium]|nr:hypothetical protein [Puniceicoccales bacterium]
MAKAGILSCDILEEAVEVFGFFVGNGHIPNRRAAPMGRNRLCGASHGHQNGKAKRA